MAKQFVALTFAMLVIVGAATQSAPAGELIPFKGKETGTLFLESLDLDLGIVVVVYEGHGRGTVVGNYTTRFTNVIDATGNFLSTKGSYRAANGDEIYVTFEPAGGSQATITDGTGRFEGAHGHYELLLVTEEPPLLENLPIAATAEYEGLISSPGANRKRN